MNRTSITCVCVVMGLLAAPSRAAELPASLAVVPGDAAAFFTVDVPAVLESPLCDEVRFVLGAIKPAELAAFTKKFPVDPTTVERVVVVLPTAATLTDPIPQVDPMAVSAIAIFGCSKAFDPVALNKGFQTGSRPKSYRGRTYQFDDGSWSGLLILPGNREFVIATEESLIWLIDRMEKGEVAGVLSPARAEAVGHTFFAAMNPAAAMPEGFKLPPDLQPLATAQRVCFAVDLGKTVKGSVELHYGNADGAAAGEKALQAAIKMGREKLKELEGELQKVIDKPEPDNKPLGLDEFPKRFVSLLGVGTLRRLDEAIGKFPLERKGTTVRLSAELPLVHGALVLGTGAVGGISYLGRNTSVRFGPVGKFDPDGKSPQQIRLGKLSDAFEAYHAEHGHYPPSMTTAKDGTPLLSWRVLLLPYLGEKKLYGEFRQNEPWDSQHNKKLIARMPDVFKYHIGYRPMPGRTRTQVITGPGTLFANPTGVKKPAGSAAILAVEPADDWRSSGLWWTKPTDLVFAPGKPPKVFEDYEYSSCWVLLANGTVKMLTKNDDEKRLAEMIAPKPKRD